MEAELIYQLIGVIFLLFRYWLTEIKLVNELQFRNHYISRIVIYYLGIALMVGLNSDVWNYCIILPLPVVIVSFIGWDSLFFKKFKSRTYWEKNHGWLIIERLTLHMPLMIVGVYFYATGLHEYVNLENMWGSLFIAVILLIFPFLFLDKRWKDKKWLPKEQNGMFYGFIIAAIGFIIIFVL